MKCLVVITESHQELYQEFFLKSLRQRLEIAGKILPSTGDGSYLSEAWQDGVSAKLEWVRDYVASNPGDYFILSDVDIQFFDGFSPEDLLSELKNSGMDILFQRENTLKNSKEVNTGFYIARATPYVGELVSKALEHCRDLQIRNDQVAINALLEAADCGKWGFLSGRYYARSQGFPPPRNIVIHHANCTTNVAGKMQQLRQIRNYIEGSPLARFTSLWSEIRRYSSSGKLMRMILGKLGMKGGV